MSLNTKNGHKYEHSNSKGISLMSVIGKIYGRVLIERISNKTDDEISEIQSGFRRGRGYVNHFLKRGKHVINS